MISNDESQLLGGSGTLESAFGDYNRRRVRFVNILMSNIQDVDVLTRQTLPNDY